MLSLSSAMWLSRCRPTLLMIGMVILDSMHIVPAVQLSGHVRTNNGSSRLEVEAHSNGEVTNEEPVEHIMMRRSTDSAIIEAEAHSNGDITHKWWDHAIKP